MMWEGWSVMRRDAVEVVDVGRVAVGLACQKSDPVAVVAVVRWEVQGSSLVMAHAVSVTRRNRDMPGVMDKCVCVCVCAYKGRRKEEVRLPSGGRLGDDDLVRGRVTQGWWMLGLAAGNLAVLALNRGGCCYYCCYLCFGARVQTMATENGVLGAAAADVAAAAAAAAAVVVVVVAPGGACAASLEMLPWMVPPVLLVLMVMEQGRRGLLLLLLQ